MAGAVIRQGPDHAAVGDTALTATSDHSLHFLAQADKALDLAVDLAKMAMRDLVHFAAWPVRLIGKREQLPDRSDVESKIARVADEAEASYMRV